LGQESASKLAPRAGSGVSHQPVKVFGIGANVQGELASKDTTVSRIQFAVPILLPTSEREWHKEFKGKGE
jgi:hypothetical protein